MFLMQGVDRRPEIEKGGMEQGMGGFSLRVPGSVRLSTGLKL